MKYGFIGCGNMGSAIACALAKITNDIIITDRSGKARQIAQDLDCTYADSATILQSCDAIFLAIKPQMMRDFLTSASAVLQERKPLLITMAAGIKIQQIESFAGTTLPVIRIMPNTPVAVEKGMIPYCYNSAVSESMLSCFLADMQYAGTLDKLDEHLIDAASALSGSGPAYLYLLLEAMADGAVACGLPRAKAMDYAAITMAGAAEVFLKSGKHPGALKDAVCSPGGSTIAGIQVLEQRGFRGAVIDCIQAAYNRNKELGK